MKFLYWAILYSTTIITNFYFTILSVTAEEAADAIISVSWISHIILILYSGIVPIYSEIIAFLFI